MVGLGVSRPRSSSAAQSDGIAIDFLGQWRVRSWNMPLDQVYREKLVGSV